MNKPPDPVLARRARVARLVAIGKRLGYSTLLVAIAVFVIGLVTDFPTWTVDACVIALVIAAVVLPAPIVLGYGIRAAEREERRTHPSE